MKRTYPAAAVIRGQGSQHTPDPERSTNMARMVFDVGGTAIKYSVMDETLKRWNSGEVSTPLDTQEHFFLS